MDCPTHAHYKWSCPESNGRHEWEWDKVKIKESGLFDWFIMSHPIKIGIPVRCAYGCGAYGIEWYKFEELIEGE